MAEGRQVPMGDGVKDAQYMKELKGRRKSSAAVMYDTASAPESVKRRHEIFSYVRFTIILALLVVILLSLFDVLPIMNTVGDTLIGTIRGMGIGGGFVYALLCAMFVVVCVPASLLSLAGGYIWENTVYGFLAAWPGIMLGSAISFFMGRVMFKEFLETELRGNLKFAALSQAAEDNGYKVVFFGRLSPIPTGLLNYAFAISAITFKQFFVATGIGLVPIAVLYAKAGSDFFTFFETRELQEEIEKCATLVPACCSALEAGTITAADFGNGCPYPALEEILIAHGEDSCMTDADDANKLLMASCLIEDSSQCSFDTIDTEAQDLSCKYNDVNIACISDGVDNNNCLRGLNNAELWPKIVLPVALVITVGIVGYFGKRGLSRAGLLQISYNLDRQHELLMAERELLDI